MKRSQVPSGAGRSASQEAGDDDFLEVVRATSDGILVVDDADLVRFANPAASQVLGRSERELLDLPFGLPLVSSGSFAQIDVTRPNGSTVVIELHVAAGRWRGTDARVVTLRDISARAAAQRELARSEERFALSAAGANDGLWDWEQESGRMHTSARLQEMLGYERIERDESPDALLGLVHPDDVDVLRDEIRRHLTGRSQQFRHEFRLRRRDGYWIWVMARGVGVTEGGQVRRFAGSLTDVTDRKQAEEELRRLALRDSLTGLANRALFLDHLDTAIERRGRMRSDFAVLFVDLDRFKLVNDSLGHTAGDIVLVEIGRRLEECLRSVDTVARLGGDEFAVLIDAPDGHDTVLATVERIRRAIAEPVSVGRSVVRLTASVGVVHPKDVPGEADAALRYADIAMYRQARRSRRRRGVLQDDAGAGRVPDAAPQRPPPGSRGRPAGPPLPADRRPRRRHDRRFRGAGPLAQGARWGDRRG